MKEDFEDQAVLSVWVNKNERIVTFRNTDGFTQMTFQSQEEKMAYIYNLCESGYRIL